MEYLAQLRSSDELEVHEKFINQRLETLKVREQQAINEKNKLQKRLDGLNSVSDSAEVDRLEGRIKEANREIESIADSSHELSLNLALKRAQIKYEETVSFNGRRDARVVLVLGWFLGVIGAALAIVGFPLWYKKLQRYQDRVVKKEAEDKLSAAPAKQQVEQEPSNKPHQAKLPEPAK
jgi:hypothetical protein